MFSTIYFDDNRRRKRDTLSAHQIIPDKPLTVTKTEVPDSSNDLDSGLYILGGFRGPVTAGTEIEPLSDIFIQSGLNSETASHVIPTMSLQSGISQHP